MQTLQEAYEYLIALEKFKKFHKLDSFKAYPKQLEFFSLGKTKRERALFAGNQLGKSEGGAYEVACHLTGRYPDWWPGRRWDRPVRGWAAGETGLVTRDVSQKKLCGPAGVEADFGSGFIPKDDFVEKPNLARGVADAFDTLQVKHQSGGTSTLTFKSYEQGRTKFQADTLDFAWLDEEPDEEIYNECLARITATDGMLLTTYTPLKGRTKLVMRFMDEPSPDRAYVLMSILDAGHISPEQRATIIAGYPAHERDARTKGLPLMGSGRVFMSTLDELIKEPAIASVPVHWGKIWGVDFGIDHPFAAVLAAWDRETDTVHILHTIRMANELPMMHARAMKAIGAGVPVAWPHDGHNRDKGTGLALKAQYAKEGLQMLPEHATWPDGSLSVEASVVDITTRAQVGQFKVAAHLNEFFDEWSQYHRKDGIIVAQQNDILDATHKIMMQKRSARAVPLGSSVTKRRATEAEGIDFDLF